MELIELIAPQVALPVVGVLIFAFMVFAFGFRSPVQPPSFQFEDETEEKRIKRSKQKPKARTSSNGHITQSQNESSVVSKTKTSPKKTPKDVAAKASTSANKPKESVNQKAELKKEKPVLKKEKVTKPVAKAVPRKTLEEQDSSVGEWTMIQKGRKSQKGSNKQDDQAEAAVEPTVMPETTIPVDAAAAAAAPTPTSLEGSDGPKTPLADKKKKKKGKDIKDEAPAVSVTSQDIESIEVDGKKKKGKSEKKTPSPSAAGAASASVSSEKPPQEATPASVSKPATNEEKSEKREQPVKELSVDGKRKKEIIAGKKDNKAKKEETAASTSVTDDKGKKGGKKTDSVKAEDPAAEKSTSSNKKKDIAYETVEVEDVSKSDKANIQIKEVTESVKKQKDDVVEAPAAKEPSKNETVDVIPDKPAGAETAGSPVSFDEMGDSWVEAAPKKKKKSRRD